MYTWEVKNYLNKKNYSLSKNEIKYILNRKVNPQIFSIEWQDFNNGFYVTTKEENNDEEYYDGFFFRANDYNIENDYLNSGIKKYLTERDYRLTSEEICYLILGNYPNTRVTQCKWENEQYYLKLEIKTDTEIKYYESYKFLVHQYDYKRVNKQIVLRFNEGK